MTVMVVYISAKVDAAMLARKVAFGHEDVLSSDDEPIESAKAVVSKAKRIAKSPGIL
jgi:hypothetical protein